MNNLLSSPTSCSFCCFLIMVTAEKIVIPTPRTIGIQLDVHKLSITRAAGNRKIRHANVDIIRRALIDSRIIPISTTSLELAWIHFSSSIVRMVQPRNKFWPPPQAKLYARATTRSFNACLDRRSSFSDVVHYSFHSIRFRDIASLFC